MRHAIIASVVCMVVVATGTLVFRVRPASGLSPWGPYESDINKDRRVNSTDMLIVAQNFGKQVPTATFTPTTTPPAPTPTPGPAWRQYSRTASWPGEYSFKVWCDWGNDRLLAGSWDWSPIAQTDPVTGATRKGALISTPGYSTVQVTCFDEYEYYDPLASFCFETYTGTAWVPRCT